MYQDSATKLCLDALGVRDRETVLAAEGQLATVGTHLRSGLERPAMFNRRQSDRNQVISRSRASTLSSVAFSHLITGYAYLKSFYKVSSVKSSKNCAAQKLCFLSHLRMSGFPIVAFSRTLMTTRRT